MPTQNKCVKILRRKHYGSFLRFACNFEESLDETRLGVRGIRAQSKTEETGVAKRGFERMIEPKNTNSGGRKPSCHTIGVWRGARHNQCWVGETSGNHSTSSTEARALASTQQAILTLHGEKETPAS